MPAGCNNGLEKCVELRKHTLAQSCSIAIQFFKKFPLNKTPIHRTCESWTACRINRISRNRFGLMPQDYSLCMYMSPFHPHGGESPLHPMYGGESPLHPMYGGESPLHSKEVLVFNLVLRSNPFQSKRLVSHRE